MPVNVESTRITVIETQRTTQEDMLIQRKGPFRTQRVRIHIVIQVPAIVGQLTIGVGKAVITNHGSLLLRHGR